MRVRNAKAGAIPHKLTDGGGMLLLVQPNGGKYWRLSYRFLGKQTTFAFGVYPVVTLATAWKKRDEAREQIAAASIRARRRRTRNGFPSRSEGGGLLQSSH